MGHVNHGKTTLLDALRETQLVEHEAGGITQNIRAFRVFWERVLGRKMDLPTVPWITFLDTPGHEAFTQMRARGASVTDLVVLVIAADDGVMPQTLEAIDHARAASVPIIVALNKCDKENVQRRAIYRALEQQAGLVVEALGGDVQCVEISALKRLHLDQLVEAILLQAAFLESERTTKIVGPAEGVCLEARMDRGHGLVLDCVLRQGKLVPGDILVTPHAWGKVRLLLDESGERLKEAWPSQPVTVIGMRRLETDTEALVEPGSFIRTVASEQEAKIIAKPERASQQQKISTTTLASPETGVKREETQSAGLNLIIRGTYRGTVEAIAQAVQQLSAASFPIRILHCSTGAVCKADILLASSVMEGSAQIIAFQTKVPRAIAEMAANRRVPIKSFSVIYEILEDIRQEQKRALGLANKTPTITGRAQVQQLFTYSLPKRSSSKLSIGGCRVVDGIIRRRQRVRVLRQGTCVYEGSLSSLKHFRDDVPDVRKGQECGLAIAGFDFEVGDEVVSLEETE
jgi:translation initiation factor IF-2